MNKSKTGRFARTLLEEIYSFPYSLDVKYAAIHLTFGNKLNFAPLQDPQHALDVGTGTGIWAIDFAEENPGCTGTTFRVRRFIRPC